MNTRLIPFLLPVFALACVVSEPHRPVEVVPPPHPRVIVVPERPAPAPAGFVRPEPMPFMEEMVCATEHGKAYHREDCSTLSRSRSLTKLTRKEAIEAGLRACEVCRPDERR